MTSPDEPAPVRLFAEGFALRDYQAQAVRAAFDYLARPDPGRAPVLTLPTGAGKSLVCAELVREAVRRDPRAGVLVLTHRAELIRQNVRHLREFARLSCAIYGAALGSKELGQVTFAMMQSFVRVPEEHYRTDVRLVVVDEAHLVGPRKASGYQKIFARLAARTAPECFAVVGLTATPFRADGSGYLWEPRRAGHVRTFDGEAHRVSIAELIAQGFLVPPVTHEAAEPERIALDRIRRGPARDGVREYRLGDQEEDLKARIERIAAAVVQAGEHRRKWLVFTVTKVAAHALGEALRALGTQCEVVLDETPEREREDLYVRFRDPEDPLRALVGCEVLSTGFDAPAVDLLALVRATASPVLYAQIVGRALRPHPGKTDALVLDFGHNALRHGPVDDLTVERQDDPLPARRVCRACGRHNPPDARRCEGCGKSFVKKTPSAQPARGLGAVDEKADTLPLWSGSDAPRVPLAKRRARKREPVVPDLVFEVATTWLRRREGRDGRPDWLEMVYRGASGEQATEGFWPEHSEASHAMWVRRRNELGSHAQASTVEECLVEWRTWRLPVRVGCYQTEWGRKVCRREYAGDTPRGTA